MSDECADLFFGVDGTTGFRLRADDATACGALACFSRLVNLPLVAPEGHAHAHLRSTEPPPELAQRFHLHQDRRTLSFFRGNDHDFYLHARDDGNPRATAGKLQKLLLYGYAAGLMSGNKSFDLIHGALLEKKDGSGVILFGDSGIGKSTTVRRWRAAGKTAIADDMVFLFVRDGKWFARPLPTWSAVMAGDGLDQYDFNREIHVGQALLLLRDPEKEHIGDLPAVHYRLAAVKAISETSSWLFRYLPEDWRDALASALMAFSMDMVKSFPPKALFAHLDGNIVETLGE